MNRPPNMQQLMKQAQQMQEQMMAAQAEFNEMTFEGTAVESQMGDLTGGLGGLGGLLG